MSAGARAPAFRAPIAKGPFTQRNFHEYASVRPSYLDAYDSQVYADYPAAYYPLADAAGATTLVDVIGGLNLTVNAGVATGVGSPPNQESGAAFDGTTNVPAQSGTATAAVHPANAITVEMIVNPTASGTFQDVVADADSPTTGGWAIVTEDGWAHLRAYIPTSSSGFGNLLDVVWPANAGWVHVAVTFANATGGGDGNIYVYLNGALAAQTAFGLTTQTLLWGTNSVISIGGSNGQAKPYTGGLAALAIYPAQLSAARIAAHFNALLPPETAAPTADDSAVESETPTLAVDAAPTDAATSSDAITAGLTTAITDDASSTDVTAVAAAVGATDSAGVTDSASPAAAAALSDTGTASQSASLSAAAAVADSVSATQALSSSAAVGSTDNAAVSDAGSLAAATTVTDAGTVTMTEVAAAAIGGTDASAGSDTGSVAAAGALSDISTATDAGSMTAALGAADSGQVAEGVSVNTGGSSQAVPMADASSETDASSVAAAGSLADTAAVGDGASSVVALGTSESAAQVAGVSIMAMLAGADVAAFGDALGVTITVPLAEAGTSSETTSTTAIVGGLVDAAGAAEVLVTALAAIVADLFTAAETVSFGIRLADAAAVIDALPAILERVLVEGQAVPIDALTLIATVMDGLAGVARPLDAVVGGATTIVTIIDQATTVEAVPDEAVLAEALA